MNSPRKHFLRNWLCAGGQLGPNQFRVICHFLGRVVYTRLESSCEEIHTNFSGFSAYFIETRAMRQNTRTASDGQMLRSCQPVQAVPWRRDAAFFGSQLEASCLLPNSILESSSSVNARLAAVKASASCKVKCEWQSSHTPWLGVGTTVCPRDEKVWCHGGSIPPHPAVWSLNGNCSGSPQPVQLVWKVLAVDLQFVPQYEPPFVTLCLAGFEALEKGKRRSTPPICTAVRLLFLPQYASHLYRRYFWENTRDAAFCLQLEASCLQWSFFTHSWQF